MRTRTRPMRPVSKTVHTCPRIPGQPGMQRLPGHPPLLSHRPDRLTLTDHRPKGLIPLLSHRQLPHGTGVSPITRSRCNPSAETLSGINRSPDVKHQAE